MTADLVTELVELVDAYHRAFVAVHGQHPAWRCPWCAQLHAQHEIVLGLLEQAEAFPPDDVGLAEAVA